MLRWNILRLYCISQGLRIFSDLPHNFSEEAAPKATSIIPLGTFRYPVNAAALSFFTYKITTSKKSQSAKLSALLMFRSSLQSWKYLLPESQTIYFILYCVFNRIEIQNGKVLKMTFF